MKSSSSEDEKRVCGIVMFCRKEAVSNSPSERSETILLRKGIEGMRCLIQVIKSSMRCLIQVIKPSTPSKL
jgi:hypothetical protein